MKIKKFEVVELKNKNRATILDIKGNCCYLAEIVNSYGITIDKRIITNEEIEKVIYEKGNQR